MGGNATISQSENRVEAVRLQISTFGAAVPIVHGRTRVSGVVGDYGNFTANAVTTTTESGGKGGGGVEVRNTTYTYTADVVFLLCEGPISDTPTIWENKYKHDYHEGPWGASLTLIFGTDGQPHWSVLDTIDGGSHSIGYSGLAAFCIDDYELWPGASLPAHSFEVIGPEAYGVHGSVPDADPAVVLREWVTHPRRGRGMPSSLLGDTTVFSTYCKAAGLLVSPALTEQAPLSERIKGLCDITRSWVVLADQAMHIVPLAGQPITRTYPAGDTYSAMTVTYTPDVTPLFDLDEQHLLPRNDAPLVRVTRRSPADAYNQVTVEFTDRANDYAIGYCKVSDRASVDIYGARPAPTLKLPWVHDYDTADRVARMWLDHYTTVTREYEFDLPWNFADLLPSNIVRITDSSQDIVQTPVRIRRIREERDGFVIQAEDFPTPVSGAPAYTLPSPAGFRHDYAADPGDTDVHLIFEAPQDLTASGLELWAAVGGGANWGGCDVWVSLTGSNYRRVSTLWGGSRYGRLSAPIAGGVAGVSDVTGILLAASATEAAARETLCYIGGATPEYLAYTTATLTAPGAYNLGGLVRGVYHSADSSAHATNDPFVRCDDALAKSGPLELSRIGSQVYLKFTSFNKFGQQVQQLADVDEHVYTIQGTWALQSTDPRNVVQVGSFDAQPIGQTPDTWSAGTVVTVSGQPFARSLQVGASALELLTTVVAGEGDQFWVEGYANVGGTAGTAIIGLEFFNAASASLGTGDVLTGNYAVTTTGSASGWVYRAAGIQAPAGTAYARPVIKVSGTTPGVVQLADLVVRRAASTIDIGTGATNEVASVTSSSTVTVNSAIVATSPPPGTPMTPSHQTPIISVTVDVPVDCVAVIQYTVYAKFTVNRTGLAHFSELAMYVWRSATTVVGTDFVSYVQDSLMAIGANEPIGTSKEESFTVTAVAPVTAGTRTFQLRAGNFYSADTLEVSQIKLTVEQRKR